MSIFVIYHRGIYRYTQHRRYTHYTGFIMVVGKGRNVRKYAQMPGIIHNKPVTFCLSLFASNAQSQKGEEETTLGCGPLRWMLHGRKHLMECISFLV